MVDIATALSRLAEAIFDRNTPRKTNMIEPYTLTSATTLKSIAAPDMGAGEIQVYYVGVNVRSMGTAAYIRVGGQKSLESSLVGANAYQEFEAPRGSYLNLKDFYFISDTADAVIEISGVFIPKEG